MLNELSTLSSEALALILTLSAVAGLVLGLIIGLWLRSRLKKTLDEQSTKMTELQAQHISDEGELAEAKIEVETADERAAKEVADQLEAGARNATELLDKLTSAEEELAELWTLRLLQANGEGNPYLETKISSVIQTVLRGDEDSANQQLKLISKFGKLENTLVRAGFRKLDPDTRVLELFCKFPEPDNSNN